MGGCLSRYVQYGEDAVLLAQIALTMVSIICRCCMVWYWARQPKLSNGDVGLRQPACFQLMLMHQIIAHICCVLFPWAIRQFNFHAGLDPHKALDIITWSITHFLESHSPSRSNSSSITGAGSTIQTRSSSRKAAVAAVDASAPAPRAIAKSHAESYREQWGDDIVILRGAGIQYGVA